MYHPCSCTLCDNCKAQLYYRFHLPQATAPSVPVLGYNPQNLYPQVTPGSSYLWFWPAPTAQQAAPNYFYPPAASHSQPINVDGLGTEQVGPASAASRPVYEAVPVDNAVPRFQDMYYRRNQQIDVGQGISEFESPRPGPAGLTTRSQRVGDISSSSSSYSPMSASEYTRSTVDSESPYSDLGDQDSGREQDHPPDILPEVEIVGEFLGASRFAGKIENLCDGVETASPASPDSPNWSQLSQDNSELNQMGLVNRAFAKK